MDGPGKLLGYRAMYQKLRQVHGLRDFFELQSTKDPAHQQVYSK